MSILSKLLQVGVLGNNKRLRSYILPNNPREFYPLVDNKIETQALLAKHNIPSPKSLGYIQSLSEVKKLHPVLKDATEFVVKPAKGAMGNGIVIIESVNWNEDRNKTLIQTTRQENMTYKEFVYYISLILSGMFSLSGSQDSALFQEKIKIHPFLSSISHRGIPDVRVIVFHGFPVMAMIRLPTQESGGRGNLHQGAVGGGIDLATGRMTYFTQNNKAIDFHPDFPDEKMQGREIPQFDEILKIAGRCGEVFPLNYIGVDIVVDPQLGPLVLEVNARPGLSIQIANRRGLDARLKQIPKVKNQFATLEEKIEFAKSKFK